MVHLEHYPAGDPIGVEVIFVPGGRFKYVGVDLDGKPAAKWLNSLGIDAYVLTYSVRENDNVHPLFEKPLSEVRNAVAQVRKGFDGKLGIWGASAGGNLVSLIITEANTNRIDFAILQYPVISMEDNVTHLPSQANLLGASPTMQQIGDFSAERKVAPNMPPTFMFHTAADGAVPRENSILFAAAMNQERNAIAIRSQRDGPHGVDTSTWRLEDDYFHQNFKFV
ncbi:Alpha/Beta hydrolase protein [Astrocystis sublimbata]|nr:Alpha/Beta hydrolase protein [Astrocystis sublimbata]